MMFDVALFSTCLLLVVSPYLIARVVRPRNQSREAGRNAEATALGPAGSGTGSTASATILEFSSATEWPPVPPAPLSLSSRRPARATVPSAPFLASLEGSSSVLDEAAVESLIARAASAAAQAASLSTVARAAASKARAASRRASEAARVVDHAADTLAATRGFSLAPALRSQTAFSPAAFTQTPVSQSGSALNESYPSRDFPQPAHRSA